MSSINADHLLWIQDDTSDHRRRAYVERPEFGGANVGIPMGIDNAYRKYLDPDEALGMAKALVQSVSEALKHGMAPDARRTLERQLDEIVIVTQNALRWRMTPRQVADE